MKRYAITPILPQSGENGYRSSAFDVGGASVNNLIPTDSETGIPLYGFTFARIGRVDFGPIFQLTNSYIFPDYPLDGQLSGIESSVLAGMKQSVEAYNLNGNGLTLAVDISDTSVSYESLLFSIYLQIEPGRSLTSFRGFDVSEGSQ